MAESTTITKHITDEETTMIQARRKDQLQIDIKAGQHELLSDVATSLGGTDAGPSPHEILEAALGACTSMTLQMYAARKKWDLTSCDTEVKFVREDKERVVLERIIHLRGNLDEMQRQRLFEIAEKCPIHEVLTRGAEVQSKLLPANEKGAK